MDAPPVDVLVLPSPNGSAIAALASANTPVLVGCLRSATATADHVVHLGFGSHDRPIGIVAAGEKWPDGSLHPAVEDLLGAGFIINRLVNQHGPAASPEAGAAAAAASATAAASQRELTHCSSGRELIRRGFERDVALAAELDATTNAVTLLDGAFRAASS